MQAGFGEKIDSVNPLSELIATAPAVSSSTAALLLRESYETTYGIYQHTPDSPSLASVLLHPAEDVSANSRLYEHIRKFINRDVGKHTALSLMEFMDLPRDICDAIFEACDLKSRTLDVLAQGLPSGLPPDGRGGKS